MLVHVFSQGTLENDASVRGDGDGVGGCREAGRVNECILKLPPN